MHILIEINVMYSKPKATSFPSQTISVYLSLSPTTLPLLIIPCPHPSTHPLLFTPILYSSQDGRTPAPHSSIYPLPLPLYSSPVHHSSTHPLPITHIFIPCPSIHPLPPPLYSSPAPHSSTHTLAGCPSLSYSSLTPTPLLIPCFSPQNSFFFLTLYSSLLVLLFVCLPFPSILRLFPCVPL